MFEVALTQLVTDVSRDVISQTAPEELPVFQEISEAYFTDPNRLRESQEGKDERLGFGVSEVISAIMSVHVLVMTDAALKTISVGAINAAAAEVVTSRGLKTWVKKVFQRKQTKEDCITLPLSKEQLQQVDEAIKEKGTSIGLTSEQVERLRDAIVRRLALGTP